jgi:hypothetical protein
MATAKMKGPRKGTFQISLICFFVIFVHLVIQQSLVPSPSAMKVALEEAFL